MPFPEKMEHFKGSVLLYQWIEDSLRLVFADLYNIPDKYLVPKEGNTNISSAEKPSHGKKIRSSPANSKSKNAERQKDAKSMLYMRHQVLPEVLMTHPYSKSSEYQFAHSRYF